MLIVENVTCELVTEVPDALRAGQEITVLEMDTADNHVRCRVTAIDGDVARVDVIEGKLLIVTPDELSS